MGKETNISEALDQIKEEFTKAKRNYQAIPGKVENVFDVYWKGNLKPLIIAKYLVGSIDELKQVEEHQDSVEMIKKKKDKKKDKDQSLIQKQKVKFKTKIKRVMRNLKAVPITTQSTWYLVIYLPENITYSIFKSHEQAFADAVGSGHCYIERKGRSVRMTISNIKLQKSYPYNFNPAWHKDMWLPLPIGHSVMGMITRDLAKMLNLLLIGVPGSGKSNIIHAWIYSLLLMNKGRMENPRVIVAVIDLKIGEFSWTKKYGSLYARTITQAEELLVELRKENKRRALIMEQSSSRKFTGWLKKGNQMPFITLFVDELAVLANGSPEGFSLLQELSSQGRSQGLTIVGAIQRPSHTIAKKVSFKDLQGMFESTLAMRVRDETNSRMALKDDRAANLEKVAGRGIFDWDVTLEVQTLYFPDPDESPEDEEFFEKLLSQLDQVPQPYTNIEGEVIDCGDSFYTSKGILPRSDYLRITGKTSGFGYGSNSFTRLP